jgi:ribA/ribD-fused uncharacterized protein
MATGFPIKVMGREFLSSEALYQACKYPRAPNIQEEIRLAATPKAAKLVSRRYDHLVRNDWLKIRSKVMRWVLRIKGSQYKKEMLFPLIQTGAKDVVEKSTRDGYWGAIQIDDELVGMNVLGRLLMELRDEARNSTINLMEVDPPLIEDFRIFDNTVGISPSRFP